MTYHLPSDDQPDQTFTGIEITARGKVQLVGDRRRYNVIVGDRLEVASRLPLPEAMHRAIEVIQRGRYADEVTIQPALDIALDYLYHGYTAELERLKKAHQARQREERKARRQKEKEKR